MAVTHKAVLVGVAAAAFLGPFTQTVYAPSLPELGTFFQINMVLVNLTISLFTAILAVSNFVFGPMADRWGRRAVLLPGLVAFTAGSLLCLFAASYPMFLAGRVVQAIGISTALLVAPTVIGDIYPPHERVPAMAVFQTVMFLGPVFGPVVGGLIAAYLHWQWAFALLAAGGVTAFLYNRARLPETLPPDVVPVRFTLEAMRAVLANRPAFSIIVLGFSQFFGYYVFLVFLPALLQAFFPQSTSAGGLFFVPLTAGILAGINLGGRLQRRWGGAAMVGASAFGIGLDVLLFWLALATGLMSVPLLVALLLAYGMLLGCSLPVQSAILVNLFAQGKGTAVGLYNSIRFAGAAIGPIAGGFISLAYGVNAVFLTLGIMLLFAAWLVRRNLVDPLEGKRAH